MEKKLLAFFIVAFICNFNYAQDWVLNNIDPDTGDEAYEIASGDIDGDGDMDIVMATYDYNGGTPDQDYIKCYLNDGNGNFPITITVSSTIQWVDGLILADVNEDGAEDIVATSAIQNKLVYYLSSTSMDASYTYTEVAVDDAIIGPGQVVAGDINGDTHVDLVSVSYDTNRTPWYSGDGLGNFTTEDDIENATSNGPFYVDLGDFDADGDLDVLVGYYNTGSIEIFYNQYDGTDPDPTSTVSWVQDTETIDSGNPYLFVIAFADVNNDGTLDVVKLDNSSGDVEWFSKIKNGASTAYTISDENIISRPGAFEVVDIDEDGLNDFILTDSGASDDAIIWFKGASNAAPSATPQLIINNNYQMFDITTADFDGDSDIDIGTIGNFSDTVDWIENMLNGLSVDNSELHPISISPNPTKNVLNFEGFDREITVSVFDILGKQVLNQSLQNGEKLNVSQLDRGVYSLKVNDALTTKFIKE